MAYQTFYRKYRPKQFAELDLKEIGQSLLKRIKSGRIPQALLFSGPKGTGKTSAARIIAKAINCQKPKAGEPCNRCSICLGVDNGSLLDLVEIDAASNRGIDDIRDLREKIKLAPTTCKYKVYIVDEVHMLTNEAFNALLKTLEEPPTHAIFILCTTNQEKLPPTIISRCLVFNFRQAKKEELINSLNRVVKNEKLNLEKGVLEAIAKSADGSFRDAQKILEELASRGSKISLKETEKYLSQSADLSPEKLLVILAKKSVKEALNEIDRLAKIGDLLIFNQRLLEHLRQLLLVKIGVNQQELSSPLISFSIGQIKQLINLFIQVGVEMKWSPILQLPLEMAVVEYCLEGEKVPEGIIRDNQGLAETKVASQPGNGQTDLKSVENKWAEILSQVKPLNHSVEALLRASRPIKIDEQSLTLEVFYQFHKDRLESEKCRQIVEEAISQTFGCPRKIKLVLGEKKNNQNQMTDIFQVANEIFNGKIN